MNDSCTRVNSAGVAFEEFSCMYPTYGKTYWPIEIEADIVPMRDWMRANFWLPVAACFLYGAGIVYGRKYFEGKPAWNLRGALALWNFSLSLFSFMGFIRTFPYLFHNLMSYTWRENFCIDPETHVGSGSTGIWCQLFTLSKLPELVDTFFIIVHKKPLIFLHWYHHVSVLLFTWHAYVYNSPTGIMFCSMNYAVHAIMYFYYFLMAVHCKPKWFKPVWITVFQISQMFVGVTITVMGCYLVLVEQPENCWLQPKNNYAAMAMYGSYLYLFLDFFLKRYFGKRKAAKKLN